MIIVFYLSFTYSLAIRYLSFCDPILYLSSGVYIVHFNHFPILIRFEDTTTTTSSMSIFSQFSTLYIPQFFLVMSCCMPALIRTKVFLYVYVHQGILILSATILFKISIDLHYVDTWNRYLPSSDELCFWTTYTYIVTSF